MKYRGIFLGAFFIHGTLKAHPYGEPYDQLTLVSWAGKNVTLQGYTIGYKDGYIRMFSNRKDYAKMKRFAKKAKTMYDFLRNLSTHYGDQ